MERLRLQIEISKLPTDEYAAACPILQGCHTEGRTPREAADRLMDIVKALDDMKSPYTTVAHTHLYPCRIQRYCQLF